MLFLVDVTHGHLDIWVIEISPGVLSCHDYEMSVGLFKSIANTTYPHPLLFCLLVYMSVCKKVP